MDMTIIGVALVVIATAGLLYTRMRAARTDENDT
jgi:hypothetical protein